MPCIELAPSRTVPSWWIAAASVLVAVGVAGCGSRPSAPPAPQAPAAAPAPAPSGARLPAPAAARNWNDFKVQAARRIVAANPNGTYTGKPQQMLLAAPVLMVELNGDGSIRKIEILRRPSQAQETVQMAIDAVRRAAPFGDVSRLPKPWSFSETFLFNDDKRFKPRTIDAP